MPRCDGWVPHSVASAPQPFLRDFHPEDIVEARELRSEVLVALRYDQALVGAGGVVLSIELVDQIHSGHDAPYRRKAEAVGYIEASGVGATATLADRSEERRVGKECWYRCRSRWSPYH